MGNNLFLLYIYRNTYIRNNIFKNFNRPNDLFLNLKVKSTYDDMNFKQLVLQNNSFLFKDKIQRFKDLFSTTGNSNSNSDGDKEYYKDWLDFNSNFDNPHDMIKTIIKSLSNEIVDQYFKDIVYFLFKSRVEISQLFQEKIVWTRDRIDFIDQLLSSDPTMYSFCTKELHHKYDSIDTIRWLVDQKRMKVNKYEFIKDPLFLDNKDFYRSITGWSDYAFARAAYYATYKDHSFVHLLKWILLVSPYFNYDLYIQSNPSTMGIDHPLLKKEVEHYPLYGVNVVYRKNDFDIFNIVTDEPFYPESLELFNYLVLVFPSDLRKYLIYYPRIRINDDALADSFLQFNLNKMLIVYTEREDLHFIEKFEGYKLRGDNLFNRKETVEFLAANIPWVLRDSSVLNGGVVDNPLELLTEVFNRDENDGCFISYLFSAPTTLNHLIASQREEDIEQIKGLLKIYYIDQLEFVLDVFSAGHQTLFQYVFDCFWQGKVFCKEDSDVASLDDTDCLDTESRQEIEMEKQKRLQENRVKLVQSLFYRCILLHRDHHFTRLFFNMLPSDEDKKRLLASNVFIVYNSLVTVQNERDRLVALKNIEFVKEMLGLYPIETIAHSDVEIMTQLFDAPLYKTLPKDTHYNCMDLVKFAFTQESVSLARALMSTLTPVDRMIVSESINEMVTSYIYDQGLLKVPLYFIHEFSESFDETFLEKMVNVALCTKNRNLFDILLHHTPIRLVAPRSRDHEQTMLVTTLMNMLKSKYYIPSLKPLITEPLPNIDPDILAKHEFTKTLSDLTACRFKHYPFRNDDYKFYKGLIQKHFNVLKKNKYCDYNFVH
ncbi:hypothetical protein CYY_002642 [Polysphondylium violaceum]|uniref:Uncharacterized protein n=1 Tax=Polysphondylium violaceum TaxID=133409 RepID=A0A8J4V252_9MYCE|nr:hypothetical protein CYY_002642 [Polysphondylium violaceum]